MNVEKYLMRTNNDDEWVERWEKKIGFEKMTKYRTQLLEYVNTREVGTEVFIESIVQDSRLELFTKTFCMLKLEHLIDANFSADYERIKF